MATNIKNLLSELKNQGVLLSPLSKELGLHPSALSPNKPLAVWHLEPLRRAIRKRGLILSRCGNSDEEIATALNRAKVRVLDADQKRVTRIGKQLLTIAAT